MSKPYISIVIPVYNEEENLPTLFERTTKVMDDFGKSYELILTNDGSKDKSIKLLEKFYKERSDVIRVIDFNGNFGQHMAVIAGFELAKGDIIVTLDADLQNPPEEIPKLIKKMEEGYDLVSGIRSLRQDNWFRRNVSRMVNKVRDKITNIEMADHGCMLRAYSRQIVDMMIATEEQSMFIPALAYSFAGNPTEIPVAHDERGAGESKYSLYKLIRLNFDLMTGYSLVPLQFFTLCGVSISFLSILFVIFLFVRRLIVGPEAQGVFTLFAILFFLIGVLLMGLGVMGEYVGRIYQEVRKYPRFAIKKVYAEKKPNIKKEKSND
jgi:undecaprenyl-phosphate 4-deoxy-4-formamido-L-arabinose transferase